MTLVPVTCPKYLHTPVVKADPHVCVGNLSVVHKCFYMVILLRIILLIYNIELVLVWGEIDWCSFIKINIQ